MKNTAQKNMVLLAASALVLVALNASIWVAAQKGSIGPVENMPLWGAFVALNVVSVLWAISQLGLQPLVVAASYVGGGLLAFQGARGLAGVSVAELTTAGATYGAFGALAVGNATMKVRLAFFSKKQVPFIFIIAALLLVDAFLNSRVSQAGWNVILNAVVLPFIVAGCVIGGVWMAVSHKFMAPKPAIEKHQESTVDEVQEEIVEDQQVSEQLMIKVPERVDEVEDLEQIAATLDDVESKEVEEEPAAAIVEMEDVENITNESDDFFPLEIDKNEDDFILPQTDSGLMEVAAKVVADAVEESRIQTEIVSQSPVIEYEPVVPIYSETPGLTSEVAEVVPTTEPEIQAEPEVPAVEEIPAVAEETATVEGESETAETEVGSEAWLNGHLDLLKKIK